MADINRREFVKMMSVATAGTALAPMALAESNYYGTPRDCIVNGVTDGFGPIAPKLPKNTHELPAQFVGQEFLALPENFEYSAYSFTGDTMSDGVLVPGDHDGMGCFRGPYGSTILVRNHEQSPGEDEAVNAIPPSGKVYDPFILPEGQGGGGTTNLLFDRYGKLRKHFVSLGGTYRNCAGGETPWGSWFTCEENVSTPANTATVTKKHGYVFEVPAYSRKLADPIPIIDMGRFNHEATATDPRTRYTYETEDRGDSCFYRFVPHYKYCRRWGHTQKGGSLYAMVIKPGQKAKCDGTPLPVSDDGYVDTRRGVQSFLGQHLAVEWVKIDDVDPEEDTLRFEAQSKGAAVFERGEGMWYGNGRIYFVCTSGGDADEGQIWAYHPRSNTVQLVVESTDESVLNRPDNITVAPDGSLYLCEDGGGNSQFVVGVDRKGRLFQFLKNVLPGFEGREFAGACFSSNSRFMFVNIQTPGVTLVVHRKDYRPISLYKSYKRRW